MIINHSNIYADIADSDVIYTKTLTGNGKYNMTNCKILILGIMLICCHGDASCGTTGGGDGAALKEVLNCNPNMVIMIEVNHVI